MKTIVINWLVLFFGLILIFSPKKIKGQCYTGSCPVPCYYENISDGTPTVNCQNLTYTLLFDDEFTGDALNASKWTPYNNGGIHGGEGTQSYVMFGGQNFQFRYPGVALENLYVPTFSARENDNDPDNQIESDGQGSTLNFD
jgi:hypothetical protein